MAIFTKVQPATTSGPEWINPPEANEATVTHPNTSRSFMPCTTPFSSGRVLAASMVVAPIKPKFQPIPSSTSAPKKFHNSTPIIATPPPAARITRPAATIFSVPNRVIRWPVKKDGANIASTCADTISAAFEVVNPQPSGPVNALSKALVKDLGPYTELLDDMRLVDFKVRITNGGTEAVTRVLIDSEDGQGRRWSTVGVSANIVDASFEALVDAIRWKLIRDTVPAA